MKCKICKQAIGLWGGLNGTSKTYWKHQVSKKVNPPHKPIPEAARTSEKGVKG